MEYLIRWPVNFVRRIHFLSVLSYFLLSFISIGVLSIVPIDLAAFLLYALARGKSKSIFETKDLSHTFLRFQSIRGEYSVQEQNITNDLKSQTYRCCNPPYRISIFKKTCYFASIWHGAVFGQLKNTHKGGGVENVGFYDNSVIMKWTHDFCQDGYSKI